MAKDAEPPAQLPAVFRDVLTRSRSDVLAAERNLEELAKAYSPEGLFAAAFVRLVVIPADEASDAMHGTVPAKLERLAFHLWRWRHGGDRVPTPEAVDRALEAADALLTSALLDQALTESQRSDEVDQFMAHVLIDAHVVRGSAYPEQTADEIKEIAGRFDAWFQRTLGTSATDLVDCLWFIVWTQERKITTWLDAVRMAAAAATSDQSRPRGSKARRHAIRQARRLLAAAAMATVARDASVEVPVSRTDCQLPDGSPPSEATWNALLALIGLTPQLLVVRKDVLFVRTRPVFVFAGDRVLVGGVSNALDCLWDALDQHARSDPRVWDRFQDASPTFARVSGW